MQLPAWLLAIAGNLFLNADYDIAVRDVDIAIAAFARRAQPSSPTSTAGKA
jgi:hypothetical protein